MRNPALPLQLSWIEQFKQKLHTNEWFNSLQKPEYLIVHIILWVGIGFLTGFLLKRFSKLVAIAIFCVVIMIVLQQMGVLSVALNWVRLEEALGLDTNTLSPAGASLYWQWAKDHVVFILSFVGGFFLGLKFA